MNRATAAQRAMGRLLARLAAWWSGSGQCPAYRESFGGLVIIEGGQTYHGVMTFYCRKRRGHFGGHDY